MPESFAVPGQVVELELDWPNVYDLNCLVRTDNVQLTQVTIPRGGAIPTYEAQGEIILHCLMGIVTVNAMKITHELRRNQLLYLIVNEPFSLRAIEAVTLLLTVVLPKTGNGFSTIGK
jgi:quercetin dioxygenase-like cupin family protein